MESLTIILEIQELDMKMIRLMRVKNERKRELDQLQAAKTESLHQVEKKKEDLADLKQQVAICEAKILEAGERVLKLEAKQSAVKKMDEFNALSQEITAAEREKAALEQHLVELGERSISEDQSLEDLQNQFKVVEEKANAQAQEIAESIVLINQEGRELQKTREALRQEAPEDVFQVYERLLQNKRDRVVVPIENRTCSGCHIVLTVQQESLVRKGERLVFCEHCSRILYWQESEVIETTTVATKRRRRKATV